MEPDGGSESRRGAAAFKNESNEHFQQFCPSEYNYDEISTDLESDLAFLEPSSTKSETVKKVQKVDLSKSDLTRLLSYLEGELQARDVVIATLKAEKTKTQMYQAKYGRLGLSDPLSALQRDSEAGVFKDDFSELAVGQMFDSQLSQLEKLIDSQKGAQHKMRQMLVSYQKKYSRSIKELEHEREKHAVDTAQGDDVCMLLEKERERLRQEIDFLKEQDGARLKEITKIHQSLQEEKERHRQIVLFLMTDRKQILHQLMEEKQKVQRFERQKTTSLQSSADSSTSVSHLRHEANSLRVEVDRFQVDIQALQQENADLREICKTQDEDLNLIRQNLLSRPGKLTAKQVPVSVVSATSQVSAQPPPSRPQGSGTIKKSNSMTSAHSNVAPSGPVPFPTDMITPQGSGQSPRVVPTVVASPQLRGSGIPTRNNGSSASGVIGGPIAPRPVEVPTVPPFHQHRGGSAPAVSYQSSPRRTSAQPPPTPVIQPPVISRSVPGYHRQQHAQQGYQLSSSHHVHHHHPQQPYQTVTTHGQDQHQPQYENLATLRAQASMPSPSQPRATTAAGGGSKNPSQQHMMEPEIARLEAIVSSLSADTTTTTDYLVTDSPSVTTSLPGPTLPSSSTIPSTGAIIVHTSQAAVSSSIVRTTTNSTTTTQLGILAAAAAQPGPPSYHVALANGAGYNIGSRALETWPTNSAPSLYKTKVPPASGRRGTPTPSGSLLQQQPTRRRAPTPAPTNSTVNAAVRCSAVITPTSSTSVSGGISGNSASNVGAMKRLVRRSSAERGAGSRNCEIKATEV